MISIIIPTYNEEKYLGQSLNKLRGLTIPHEIIVSDDCSTDGTVAIAKQYTDKVLIPEKKHATIGANRNYGVKKSSGEFLVFIDADSLIQEPQKFFEKALARFTQDPKLVALTGKINVSPELETFTDRLVYLIFNFTHRVKNNWLHMGEASGKFQMMRRTAFEKVGGYREDLIAREDGIMFSNLAKIGKTLYDPHLQIYYSGRRAHAIGWIKLISIWMSETFFVAFFGKNKSKDWTRWWEKKNN